MPGLNIPGVTDKYNTNDTVEKLMKVERVPLVREQDTLKTYQAQQNAWRDVNRTLTEFRDSVKTLYSYENPFNNKLASSSDEYAITADANRSAQYQSFKVNVIQPATADRFLTAELPDNTKVPQGTYTFRVADKSVSFNWKGGSLTDFSKALNKRGGDLINSLVIGSGAGTKTLLIESKKTGEANRLTFEDEAKTFAIETKMISPVKSDTASFGKTKTEFRPAPPQTTSLEQEGLPRIANTQIAVSNGKISIPPRSGFSLAVPQGNDGKRISFTLAPAAVEDITEALNKRPLAPELPNAGYASFKDVVIDNNPSDTLLPKGEETRSADLLPVTSASVVYAAMSDGSEKEIATPNILASDKTEIDIDMNDYPGIASIVIRNRNTGSAFTMSSVSLYDPKSAGGFTPNNAASTAQDAIITYEGIRIKRPTNDIDDVVPDVTLHVHEKTERTATIKIDPDVKSAKDALITFVGKYNESLAQINILSQNKSEIVDELTYLSDDRREKEKERLGLFMGDFSLTSMKSNFQAIQSARYQAKEDAVITMLSQIGISTNASGSTGGYTASRLRGYLEIDEKKLDAALASHLEDIKNMFGYDSDGDLITDSGIAYRLDRELGAYVQTGGIIGTKISTLGTRIKSSETKIAQLETQMDKKEKELRRKFASMEGSLNSLESQQTTISNFIRQNNRNAE
ncbi:flagellar filament capping protein FliD [Treponema sp. Marseille-Q4523]|uniref:flagellar filament capping protein FliD n=1 Tax=Treponema sp. Marseille-Q4523 TaxID=2810610 RepID=UPI00195F342D|nr:flagellar filament capping protein FliD [Treponema sp. Marseille-Q4523]MBM7021820.1 flagellar filament capping protein FliD [Treponema sp. Marseille-Q4523]